MTFLNPQPDWTTNDIKRFPSGTLGQLFVRFCVNRGAAMLFLPALAVALRIYLAWSQSTPWAPWEFLLTAGVLLTWPLSERYVHRYEMHTFKWHPFYTTHQRHHKAPYDADFGIVPWVVLCVFYVLTFALFFFAPRLLTLWCGIGVGLSLYEWTHFLCHTTHVPTTWWGKKIYFNHRRHHFLDEDGYMGLLFPPIGTKAKD